MDAAWLRARKKELRLTDDDIGDAIKRDRSAGNRIVSGKRQIRWVEVGFLAEVFEVSRPEMLHRAGFDVTPEAKRSIAKQDAIRLIDRMNDEDVRQLIPVLQKFAERTK